MYRAVGLIEISSIAKGIEVADAMLKSAEVELLISKTICPGKYIIMIGGDVSAVTQAVDVGESLADYLLVDKFILNNLHPTILSAISGVTPVDEIKSIGVVETFSVAACINAADFAVKVANVSLIRIHMAYGIGGKCYFVLNGDVSSVEASVAKASEVAGEAGLLVYSTVIPGPSLQLAEQLL